MTLTSKLSAIGEAIRAKTGKTEKLTLDEMPQAIESIQGASGGSGEFTSDDIGEFMLATHGEANCKLLRDWASKVAKIGEYALYGKQLWYENETHTQTHSLEFPNLEAIEQSALFGCWNSPYNSAPLMRLRVSFPKVKTIKTKGIYGNSFVGIELPSLETMESDALGSNRKLREAVLPKVTVLANSELSSCTALAKADFATLQKITANYYFYAPFQYCNNLTALILRNTSIVTLSNQDGICGQITNANLPLSPSYPSDKANQGYIYVPKALLEDYKVATNWSVYADKFRAIEDYPEICGEV